MKFRFKNSPRPVWRCLGLSLLLGSVSAQASVTVDGSGYLRQRARFIGGTNIHSHQQNFTNNASGSKAIPFQADLQSAKVPMVRVGTFPDPKATTQTLAQVDAKISAILARGAQPLFIAFLKNKDGTNPPFLKADGTAGGTLTSNFVFLVNHYKAAPFHLGTQYWEVGNEPDMTVDYQVKNAAEYSQMFNDVDAALTTAGVRGNVKLCGPVIAYGYRQPHWKGLGTVKGTDPNSDVYQFVLRNEIIEDFLANCTQSVDVVTYHDYSNESTVADLLNMPRALETKENANRTVTVGDGDANSATADRGVASLIAIMRTHSYARSPKIGCTEHNSYGISQHAVQQALWNLMLQQLHFNNATPFPSLMTNHFLWDEYGPNYGGYGPYDSNGNRDFTFWGMWMRGNLTGANNILRATATGNLNAYGNPYLMTLGSEDTNTTYLEVVNRSASPITDTVTANNVLLGGATTVYTLSQTATPDVGISGPAGTSFSYSFPAYSATVFKFNTPRPNSPTNLTATAISSSQINLTWADNATNESGYTVQRSLDGNSWTTIATPPANATSYSNTGLTAATKYFYRVYASNLNGGSGMSNTASATTNVSGLAAATTPTSTASS